jgi:hypothetical protein
MHTNTHLIWVMEDTVGSYGNLVHDIEFIFID